MSFHRDAFFLWLIINGMNPILTELRLASYNYGESKNIKKINNVNIVGLYFF